MKLIASSEKNSTKEARTPFAADVLEKVRSESASLSSSGDTGFCWASVVMPIANSETNRSLLRMFDPRMHLVSWLEK